MKKVLLTAILAISTITLLANPIDEEHASMLARQFVFGGTSQTRAVGTELKRLDLPFAKDFLHVFNVGHKQGYVIVAGDDNVSQPILGYSDHGALTEAEMPVNMRSWLNSYVEQMKWVSKHPECKKAEKKAAMPHRRAGSPVVQPLLGDIAWGQGEPYNLMTPVIGERRSLTGCVATASAQIMYYHRWPEHGTGSKTYHDPASNQDVSTNFEEHSYDWNSMTPLYDNTSSESSRNAVAQLMFDAGVALEMQYSLSNSLTFTSNAADALSKYFGYDERVYCLARRNVSGSTWEQVMQNELNAQRPMIYSGSSENAADGHAFVCDGYDNEGYYHFNWGWEGSYNGWFLLTTMNPGNNAGYVSNHEMVCNIARPGLAGDPLINTNIGTFEFDTASGLLTIHCSGDQSSLESAEYYPWYQHKDQVKSVVFAQGITSIGNFVFEGYPSLNSVTLPEGVEMIGYNAFENCPIEKITMPESLVTICGWAFSGTKLTSVTFGRNIANLGNAFFDTPSLKEFHVSAEHPRYTSVDGVIYDKNLSKLIYLPSGIEKLALPESVERIGEFAASGSCLTEVILPDAIVEIEMYAFSDCKYLKKITFPKRLSVIHDGLLWNCNALEEINMGPNISVIENSFINNANNLKEITFPASLRSIGSWSINYCENLTSITCNAKQAPVLGDCAFQLLGNGAESTLKVPRGSDYSSWIAMLGPHWTVQYFDPVEDELANTSEECRGWVGYASSGYTTDISVGWTQPFRSDVAIFLSNSSNSIGQGLEVEGRTLYSLAIMGGRDKPISGKAWISTKLPQTADDADICSFDIDCSYMARFEYSTFVLPEPVVIPEGGCYIGFTFESEGYSFPFNCDQQFAAGLAFNNSCFVRSTNNVYNEWTDIHNQYFATIKYQLKRQFFEHDVVPVSAMHTSAFVGNATTTTMSLSSIGLSSNVGTVGISIYYADSGSWGEVTEYKVDKRVSIGAQAMIDITIPAAQKDGNLVDSVKIVKIDGFDNPSMNVAIPIYLCNVANPIPHHVVVNNYISKTFGETMSAFVSSDLLKKEFGEDVIIINSLKQDPVVPEFCSPVYTEKLTTYIDECYHTMYHPYKGLKTKGFGIEEEVRKALSVPATIEITADAEWTGFDEIRVSSKLHTLADIDTNSLQLHYFVLADSLHGTGVDWRQLNNYSGISTDDPNLLPLTEMPEYIDGLYYNNVSLIANTVFMDGELYLAPEKAGSVFSVEKTLPLNYNFFHDPSMLGYQKKDVKILVGVYDVEKNKLVNAQVVNLKAKSIEENQIKVQVYNSFISLECTGIAPYFHVKLYDNETTFADMVVNRQQVETASYGQIINDVPEGTWTIWVRPANIQMEDVGEAITQTINVYRLHDLYAYSDRGNIRLVFDSSAPYNEISVYNEAEGKYTQRFCTSDKYSQIMAEQGLFIITVRPMDEDRVLVGDGESVSVIVGNEDCSVRYVTTESEDASLHLAYVSDAPCFHITITKDGSAEIYNDIIWAKEMYLPNLEKGVYQITIAALDGNGHEISDAAATLSVTVDDANGIIHVHNNTHKTYKYLRNGKILIKTDKNTYDLDGKVIK